MDFGCSLIFMPPNSNSNSRAHEREHLLEQEDGLAIFITPLKSRQAPRLHWRAPASLQLVLPIPWPLAQLSAPPVP